MLVNFANIKKYKKYRKDTLNILDLNIHFEENCLTKEKYKGQICLNYKAPLSYHR
ncbi:hypothetical protein GT503_08920 [Enterococcus durans]|nr:hypothetical protein [Enterococcus durans]